MKKIISIIIILCMIFLLVSCSGPPIDKSIYASEDWSYLMVYGIKYVKVEQPFIIGYNPEALDIYYVQRTFKDIKVFTYKATQRHPWVWPSDEDFWLYDVTLPNDISIKFLDECGSYCLPEDKETVENMLANISWSEQSISCDLEPYSPRTPFVPLSKELSSVLISACDSFQMQDTLFIPKKTTLIMDLYQYDDQGILQRGVGSIYIIGDELYVSPRNNIVQCYDENKVNCTLEDLSSQKIPEEFHDEIMTLYDTYKDTNP